MKKSKQGLKKFVEQYQITNICAIGILESEESKIEPGKKNQNSEYDAWKLCKFYEKKSLKTLIYRSKELTKHQTEYIYVIIIAIF